MSISRQSLQSVLLWMVFVMIAASAAGYIFVPSSMLSVVGITGTAESNFLVRTLAAAYVALLPIIWAVIKNKSNLRSVVISSLGLYMIVSSAVDLQAYMQHIVGSASVPSIIFRTLLGVVIILLARK